MDDCDNASSSLCHRRDVIKSWNEKSSASGSSAVMRSSDIGGTLSWVNVLPHQEIIAGDERCLTCPRLISSRWRLEGICNGTVTSPRPALSVRYCTARPSQQERTTADLKSIKIEIHLQDIQRGHVGYYVVDSRYQVGAQERNLERQCSQCV